MMLLDLLREKSGWVRRETLKLHRLAPETRIASSLSAVEIFVSLYYGGILKHNPKNPFDPSRDRLIISKGHGSVSLYPILADLGFFDKSELEKINAPESFLRAIPDTDIPGYETTNGSLGHGLSVACGVATALKAKKSPSTVFVLCGDGELNEGSIWEAVLYAAFHRLDNLVFIIDDNKISMLGPQENILGINPLDKKFDAFGWHARTVDGHDLSLLHQALLDMCSVKIDRPRVLIANTVKGKGIASLETDPLSHIKSLKPAEIDKLLENGF